MSANLLLEKARACRDPELRLKLLRLWREKAVGEPTRTGGSPEEARRRLLQARAQALRAKLLRCSACELSRSRTRVVPWSGPIPASIAIVGEAPGYFEDERGEPFVGKAGKLLDRLLLDSGLRREEVFVTNAVLCRPPQNAKPTAESIQACLPNLQAQLDLSGARVVVALGNTAIEALGVPGPISWAVGRQVWRDGRLILATYHPAAALRDEAKTEPIRQVLAQAKAFADRLDGVEPEDLDPRAEDLPADSRYWQELLTCALLLSPDEAYPFLWYVRKLGGRCWPWVDGLGVELPRGVGAERAASLYAPALRRVLALRQAWVDQFARGVRDGGAKAGLDPGRMADAADRMDELELVDAPGPD